MDGIAVSAATVASRAVSDGIAASGGAIRLPAWAFEWIDTGDPMPDGADTVVMREWVLPQADGSVDITGAAGADVTAVPPATMATPGKNVRRAGEDFAVGETLVPAGRRLRPGDLAAAAAGGHTSLSVCRQPMVAIIPTGDEIRPAGSMLRRGDVIDTNSLMLAARCGELGALPVLSDVQPDDPDVLAAEIRQAGRRADLVLVIAGSSRGRDDHTGAVLAQVGGVAVTGVAVRPGHPALLGHVKRSSAGRGGIAPVVGLPGYPLATAVIFELFAAPLLAAAGGVAESAGPTLLATLDRDWSSPPGVEEWILVTVTPAAQRMAVATPARHGAGSISQLARADGWWRVRADQVGFAAGATIEFIALR
jgi:putative molybdopterin biosynthesis protein